MPLAQMTSGTEGARLGSASWRPPSDLVPTCQQQHIHIRQQHAAAADREIYPLRRARRLQSPVSIRRAWPHGPAPVPGSGTGNSDASHAFAPAERRLVERPARTRRKVQRVGGPSVSRSIPAQATMAALSVQSRPGVPPASSRAIGKPRQSGADDWFAATPPATTRLRPEPCRLRTWLWRDWSGRPAHRRWLPGMRRQDRLLNVRRSAPRPRLGAMRSSGLK